MNEQLIAGPPTTCINVTPLNGLTALYHRASATTHLVTEPVPEILAALGDSPLTPTQLIAALELEDSDEVRSILTARLDELEASGLISRA